jgi:hypothetical protein
MVQLPLRIPSLPSFRASVDRAVSADNLRAVAAATSDPAVLLGLVILAKPGEPARKDLVQLAVGARRDYGPVIAVLTVMMERIDAEVVNDLVQCDPDNALGHYLHATLLHVSNRDTEALASFRKAAGCAEIRCYDPTVGEALFKAIDALGFQGFDRLCALSWTVSRWLNFSSLGFQPTYWAMSELAKTAEPSLRHELADMLLTLAGHLFATNAANRFFAQRAVEASFTLQAEIAGAESMPRRHGYASAVYGLATPLFCFPGLKEWWQRSPLQLASELPAHIHRAFAAADPALLRTGAIGEANLTPPESEKPAFEAAKQKLAESAQRLLELAAAEPDGLLGPYLKALPRVERPVGPAPLWEWSPVEGLMHKRTDLFQAAATYNEAVAAVWTAGQNDPSRKNISRLMEIGVAIYKYACEHDRTYPASLELLFQAGHLKPPLEAKSLRTGRPYIYVAAGEKQPSRANDLAQFVLLYDDEPNAYGGFECAFASLGGGAFPSADLKEQLKRRGK